jgi:hypothetical protein
MSWWYPIVSSQKRMESPTSLFFMPRYNLSFSSRKGNSWSWGNRVSWVGDSGGRSYRQFLIGNIIPQGHSQNSPGNLIKTFRRISERNGDSSHVIPRSLPWYPSQEYDRLQIRNWHQWSPAIKSAPYRVSQLEWEAINTQVEEMLQAGIFKPSSSPWSSPVVMVPKKR